MAEVRLIDANALKRDLIDNWAFYSVLLKNAIERQPTIDAVPVVRCKDCKWFRQGVNSFGNHFTNCDLLCVANDCTEDDYCAWGERREENAAD